MAHFRCVHCRSRVWREPPAADHAEDLCPGCGDPLEAVTELSELVGLRVVPTRSDPVRRPAPDRSAQISQQIRETIARHDAERRARQDTTTDDATPRAPEASETVGRSRADVARAHAGTLSQRDA
jgi:hypothetical protein